MRFHIPSLAAFSCISIAITILGCGGFTTKTVIKKPGGKIAAKVVAKKSEGKAPPKLIRSFEHEANVAGADFSPDGKLLAACGGELIRVWDFQKGVQKLLIKRKKFRFADVRFHADSKLFATATRQGKVFVWNLKGGLVAEHTPAEGERVDRIAYSPAGGKLAAAVSDNSAYVWQDKNLLQRVVGHKSGVQDVAFSPNGKLLATAGGDFTVRIWDLEKRKNVQVCKHDDGGIVVHAVDFRPDGKYLASVSGPGELIHVWHVGNGKLVGTITTGHPGYSFSRVHWGPKGKLLAVGGGIFSKGFFSLWSIDMQGEKLKANRLAMFRKDGRGTKVTALAFHPDGHIIATSKGGDPEGKVTLWETGR